MDQTTHDVCPAFVVAADGYDRLMGRYLPSLGPAFADVAGITGRMRVLDVGCGPGGLTGELGRRVGAGAVAALDPSPPFVQACRERHPGVDVRIGVAEQLPFGDEEFDAALACLVVGFLNDAQAGVLEMLRVTRRGGTVAACFWDAANMPAIQLFWHAAAQVDSTRSGEIARLGSREGDLAALLTHAGLRQVEETTLTARASYRDFDDWWTPIAQGIGPAGAYYLSLDDAHRHAVRNACEQQVGHPASAFVLEGRAWCAHGTR